MGLLESFVVAIGLAMDAFAVSIASGMVIRNMTWRHVFRIAFHFGLFQFLMPIVGWLAGKTVDTYIQDYDHWVAFGLLVIIGIKMLVDSCKDEKETFASDPTKGMLLLILAIATSIDALAVGLSIALLQVSIVLPSVIIGVVCAVFSITGMTLGHRFGGSWGKTAGIVGGILLVLIGVKILVSHLIA